MFRRSLYVATTVTGSVSLGTYVYISSSPNRKDALPTNLNSFIRFGRAVTTTLCTAIDYKVSMFNLDKSEDPEKYKAALHEFNIRAAHRLYNLCHTNAGLYTKFGQSVSNLNYALPKEFTDILSPLRDRAKEMPESMVLSALKAELNQDPSEVFSEFDVKPIGAASIAQVHRAVLASTKEPVAVKLQYPYLEAQAKGDLGTLQVITDFVGYWFPDFAYSWLTPEFSGNITLELDFLQEGRNADRLRKMFMHRSDVYVPRVYWENTTKRMLVMEYIEGMKISNVDGMIEKGINPLEVARTTATVFGSMIYENGFVHCDPHGSNLFVRVVPSGWLDFENKSLLLPAVFSVSVLGLAAFGIGSSSFIVCLTGLSALTTGISLNRSKRQSCAKGKRYEVVVLDHGMYRRLLPDFRSSYCLLWKSFLLQDRVLGREAAMRLGLTDEDYDVLSLIFTFRPSDAAKGTWSRMSKEDRKAIRERYRNVGMSDVNEFLQRLPRDILFVVRCSNIIRSINFALGGTTKERFHIMGEAAVRGLIIPNPTPLQFAKLKDPELPYHGPYQINLPVASEIVDSETVKPISQTLEVWKLRTYLWLIDRSWNIVAWFVKLL